MRQAVAHGRTRRPGQERCVGTGEQLGMDPETAGCSMPRSTTATDPAHQRGATSDRRARAGARAGQGERDPADSVGVLRLAGGRGGRRQLRRLERPALSREVADQQRGDHPSSPTDSSPEDDDTPDIAPAVRCGCQSHPYRQDHQRSPFLPSADLLKHRGSACKSQSRRSRMRCVRPSRACATGIVVSEGSDSCA